MKICKKCKKEFPNSITINGKKRNLQTRLYCLECSPFYGHNTKQIHIDLDIKEKICPRCEQLFPYTTEYFYPRRTRKSLSVYCKICTNIQSQERQTRCKEGAVNYMGGKCQICGYKKYTGALEFHHLDPKQKDFTISHIKSRKLENIKTELDKCILLCSCCHKEVEAGITPLP